MANTAINQIEIIKGTNTTNYLIEPTLLGTCSTTASTAIKDVTLSKFELFDNVQIAVKFTTTNTAAVSGLKLRINSSNANDAKPIKYRGENLPATGILAAGRIYNFIYDGTNWELVGDLDTDRLVEQGVSSTGSWRKLLLSGGNVYSAKGATPSARTDVTYQAANLDFQPSTGTLVATKFSGDGSALTSLTATNITGTVPFGNLPTGTGADKVAIGNHNHDGVYASVVDGGYLPLKGGTMTGALTLTSQSSAFNAKNILFTDGGRIGGNTSGQIGLYGKGDIFIKPNSDATASTTDGIVLDSTGLRPYVADRSYTLGTSGTPWGSIYAKGYMYLYSIDQYPLDFRLYNSSKNQVAEMWYDTGNATNVTTGVFKWRQYSPNATASTTTNGKYETYNLPSVDINLAENKAYNIITTKNLSAITATGTITSGTWQGSVIDKAYIDTGIARLASPTFTGTPKAPTATDGTNDTQIATTAFVMNQFKYNDAMLYKGVVNANSDLPATHSQGWTYKVGTAGEYAGIQCEIGDMIICNTDGTAANNAHWNVIQTNIDGAVISSSTSSTDNALARWDDDSGRIIQNSTATLDDNGLLTTTSAKLNTFLYFTRENGPGYIMVPEDNGLIINNGNVNGIKYASLAINKTGITNSYAGSLGSATYPWSNLYLGPAGTRGIYYAGTSTTNRMITFFDGDSSGLGIKVGGGGVTVVGAGESAANFSVGGSNEVLYLLSDNQIYLEGNGQTIANRKGIVIDNSGNVLPVAAETATNAAQNLGASGNTWKNVYAADFYATKYHNSDGLVSFVQNNTIVDATTDWDTLLTPGCYKIQMSSWGDAETYHSPNAVQSNLYSYGLLFVIRGLSTDSEKRTLQIYFPHRTDNAHPIYCRMANGATPTWQSWHRLTRGNFDTSVLTSGTLPWSRGGTGATEHTQNRLVWSQSASVIQAGYHYANTTKIAVNSTTEPTTNFYVNGSSAVSGNSSTDTLTISSENLTSHIQFSRKNWNYITYPNNANSALAIGYNTGDSDVQQLVVQKNGLVRPGGNNTQNLGDSNHKWNTVYATTFNGNATTATKANLLAASTAENTTGLQYYSGQPTIGSADGNAYEGSSNNYKLWSYPADYTAHTTVANIQTIRAYWSSAYFHDIFMSPNNENLLHRSVQNNSARNWRVILDSANYTSYTVTKTGTGASGTWGISISGTATTATNLDAAPTITKEGTATINLAAATAYTLTVGGKTVVFKTPADSNTHSTTKLIAGGSSATANAAVSSGNVYLRLFDDSTHRSNIQLKAGTAMAITSDANGVITFTSSDTNNAATHTLAKTTKYYVTGTTSATTSTSGDSFDTGVYVTAVEGELSAARHSYNVGGTEKAYTYYNTSDDSIDFVFVA